MMCFTNAQFWCVLCVLMCVCVCVCGAGQSSQHNTKNNVIWAHAEVRRYIFVVRACVLVCVCARACEIACLCARNICALLQLCRFFPFVLVMLLFVVRTSAIFVIACNCVLFFFVVDVLYFCC